MERRLSAILAADVVGYSALMEQDEAGTFDRLRAHRKELFEPEIQKHHGRIFKLTGDGLFAEFASVVDAVECAVSLQRGLAERNANVPEDQRIDVRIGINLGEVIVEGDDRLGEGVNIAARLEQLAEPGGICVSDKVTKEVEKKLSFGFVSMGEQRVKNINEPIHVYKINLQGQRRRPAQRGRVRPSVTVLGGLISCILLLGVVAFGAWKWSSSGVAPLSQKASIAVLPFDNLGSDPKWSRFADGTTEDILTDLSHSKDLFVVARNSTEIYKGKPVDVRSIGRDLGVNYVLEGSIQPEGDQIRVTAQLIDTRTGGHVWSNRYDRPATDLFNVQRDVTERIAATLTGYEGALAEAERSIVRRKPPSNLTAYDIYLLGMEAKHKVTKEGLDEGERLFRKALELDPQLARAYVGLVYIYAYRMDLGLGSLPDNLAKQMEAARNAVRLDPNDGETQLVLGHAFAYQGKGEQGLAQFAKAEALAPNNADLLILIAWYLPALGQPERAVELTEKALRLNPNYPYWYNQALQYVYFYGQQYEKSVKYSNLVTEPFALDYAYRASASAMLGDMKAARAAAAEVARLDPNWSVEKYMSDAGGYPEAVAMLFVDAARKAGVTACVPVRSLPSSPKLIRLKSCDQERAGQVAG